MELEDSFAYLAERHQKEIRRIQPFIRQASFVYRNNDYNDTSRIPYLFIGDKYGIGKSSFYLKKSFSISLFQWLYEHDAATTETLNYVKNLSYDDALIEIDISTSYFRSLDDVMSYIDLVGDSKGAVDKDSLLSIKACACILWMGIDIYDMIDIKKSDIRGNSIEFNNHLYSMPEPAAKIINRFAMLDNYFDFPGGRQKTRVNSEYLFRSCQCDHMNGNQLSCCVYRFNKTAEKYGKKIVTVSLKKNSILCVARETGKDFAEIINCTPPVAFGLRRYYNKWNEYFWGDMN